MCTESHPRSQTEGNSRRIWSRRERDSRGILNPRSLFGPALGHPRAHDQIFMQYRPLNSTNNRDRLSSANNSCYETIGCQAPQKEPLKDSRQVHAGDTVGPILDVFSYKAVTRRSVSKVSFRCNESSKVSEFLSAHPSSLLARSGLAT